MKTVDFNIKFREKIEKGTYKVTWNNLPVRIICWDLKGKTTPDTATPLHIIALVDCGTFEKQLLVADNGISYDRDLSGIMIERAFKLQVTYQDLPGKLSRVKYCLARADVFTDNLMKEYGYEYDSNKSHYYNRIGFINDFTKRYMNLFYRKLKLSGHWEYDDEEDWNLDFKEGDYVECICNECICNDGPWILAIGDIYKILYVEQSGYITRVTIKGIKDDRTLTIGESDFIDMFKHWSILDAKDGDVLFTSSTASHETFVFKGIDEKGNVKCYFAYDSEDGFREGTYHFIGRAANCKPATKEWRDLLFQKLKEAGYEWDADKKELRKIEEYDFHGIKFIPKFAKGTIIKDKKHGEVSTVMDFSYDTGLYTHTYGQFPITIQDNYEIIG